MAKGKKGAQLFRLVSSAGTGSFVVVKRNPRLQQEKLSRRMYDPKIRKHVEFVEKKMK